jgi:hypothetical protein
LGLPLSGTVNIRTLRFDYAGGKFGNVGLPVEMNVIEHDYSDGSVTWWVTPTNNQTAYAFEFV